MYTGAAPDRLERGRRTTSEPISLRSQHERIVLAREYLHVHSGGCMRGSATVLVLVPDQSLVRISTLIFPSLESRSIIRERSVRASCLPSWTAAPVFVYPLGNF